MPWTHPTANPAPKTVALVCMGPSRNAYVGACFENDLSDSVVGADEIWTLNRGVTLFRHDLLFVMDHIQGEADQYPRYGAALWNHDRPIITSDNLDGWPAHVHAYPFREVWNWLRTGINPMHGEWFHNSVAYILVYAAYIGVTEIRVFGADYSAHRSGVVEDGHPCVAYWVGKLESAGLTVLAPGDSAFLNINQRDWLYGYRDDPRKIPANRARFRAMVNQPAAPESTALLSGERQVAPSLEQIQPDHIARYQWARDKVSGRVMDFGAGIGYGSYMLADTAESVLSVERSTEALAYAKEHYWLDNITQHAADLDNERFHWPEPANYATAFELIEHLANPKPFLHSLPADHLLCSVPNEAVIPYSPDTAPFHHRHYTKDQFAGLLQDCDWEVVGWYGQRDPLSPVIPYEDGLRTLVVEARRWQHPVSSCTTTDPGASAN